jgi:hypothetical protein
MPTLQNLVDRVRQELSGFSQNQQQFTSLNQNITNSQTSFTVADATQVSRGTIEVDNQELMLVQSVNQQTNTVNISSFGRGYASTTANSHLSGVKVENSPIWPTLRITEAINDTIRGVYPNLWGVNTTSISKISVVYQYALPANAEEVISVQYQVIGPSHVWRMAQNWRFQGQSNTLTGELGSGGKSLFIADDVVPGRQIWVTYRQEPVELVNLSDDFATTTLLPATAQDVIVYGACMKLSPQLEGPRLSISSVEASERAQYVQPGSASKVSQYYGQLYAQRLEQEAAKLRDRYPVSTHFDF